jgi:hypothetical protein
MRSGTGSLLLNGFYRPKNIRKLFRHIRNGAYWITDYLSVIKIIYFFSCEKHEEPRHCMGWAVIGGNLTPWTVAIPAYFILCSVITKHCFERANKVTKPRTNISGVATSLDYDTSGFSVRYALGPLIIFRCTIYFRCLKKHLTYCTN